MRGTPKPSDSAPASAPLAKIARQPKRSISAPAITGPHARPIPKVVPSALKARVRAWPSNSWASAAVPPASAAAAATPCAARSRSTARIEGAKPSAAELSVKPATPKANSRRRPKRSASVPAAISRLPKLSMKALVIQAIAAGLPPRSRPIAGVATAPPEKASGRASAAMQTAPSTSSRRVESG